jgi:hypothetical protein
MLALAAESIFLLLAEPRHFLKQMWTLGDQGTSAQDILDVVELVCVCKIVGRLQ